MTSACYYLLLLVINSVDYVGQISLLHKCRDHTLRTSGLREELVHKRGDVIAVLEPLHNQKRENKYKGKVY